MTDPRSLPHPRAAALEGPLRAWVLEHQEQVMHGTTWLGVPMRKSPLDAWIYQELLHEVRPEVIVEIGSWAGGSTMFFAHLLDLIGGEGTVISVDIDRSRYRASHPRILEITGSSADPEIVAAVTERCGRRSALIVHDGDHERAAVLADLRAYSPLVGVGSYYVVEDGIVDLFEVGTALHPPKFPEGPLPAIEDFLAEDDRFEVDDSRERFGVTWNPRGWLRRIR